MLIFVAVSMQMKIWDTFMFNGETHALNARLAVAGIDRRVAVESWLTHSGLAKPYLYFDRPLQNIQLVIADLSACSTPWARENEQRNAIMQGLTEADDGDVILISDADEIPTSDGIDRAIKSLVQHPAVVLCQTMYNYHYGWVDPRGWRGTVVTSYAHLKLATPQRLRDMRESLPRIPDAGEHLSWFGGVDEVSRKLTSFAHTEFSDLKLDQQDIERKMVAGEDLFGRWELSQPTKLQALQRTSL